MGGEDIGVRDHKLNPQPLGVDQPATLAGKGKRTIFEIVVN